MNATARRTPPSGSYRLRRNLLGYCLVRAVGRPSSNSGPVLVQMRGDLGGREQPLSTVDTQGWKQADRRRAGAIIGLGLVYCGEWVTMVPIRWTISAEEKKKRPP